MVMVYTVNKNIRQFEFGQTQSGAMRLKFKTLFIQHGHHSHHFDLPPFLSVQCLAPGVCVQVSVM